MKMKTRLRKLPKPHPPHPLSWRAQRVANGVGSVQSTTGNSLVRRRGQKIGLVALKLN